MELGHLTHFYHAYRGGIYGGGKTMHLTPSAMSRGVQGMEQVLGYPLFKREGNKLIPLPIAAEFYARVAAPAVEGLAQFQALGRASSDGPRLVIAATEFMVREYLSPILGLLQQQYPALRIDVQLGNRDDIDAWLERKEIDLAVIATDQPPRQGSWQPFIEVDAVFLTMAGAKFDGLEALLAEGPTRHRLVCPPPCEAICRPLAALLRERNLHWPVAIVAGSTALVPWLISAPDMIGLSIAVRALERDGIARHPLPFPRLTVGAAWVRPTTPLLRGMLDLIGRSAQEFQRLYQPDRNGAGQTDALAPSSSSRPS